MEESFPEQLMLPVWRLLSLFAYVFSERSFSQLKEHLEGLGLDGEAVAEAVRARSGSKSRSPSHSRARSESRVGRKRTREDLERSMTPKPGDGFRNVKQKLDAQKMARRDQRSLALEARKGESDRHVFDFKPKHLFSGKSTVGKRDYR